MRNTVIQALLLVMCGQAAWAGNCDGYVGKQVDTPKELAAPVDKAVAATKAHNVKGLFTLSSGKLLLLRRSVSGADDSRSGNVRLALRPRDIDAKMNIHIGNQTFAEFADHPSFDGFNTASAIEVRREVCEDAQHCEDALPGSEEVPFLLKDMLQCNQSAKGVFLLSDGAFVTDMQFTATKMPIGTALFFTRVGSNYRMAGLIIQN